ncbi:MAG: electron transfer flavoprotein subunit beta/FixA family protein [Candidatus Methanomethylicia archaeon]
MNIVVCVKAIPYIEERIRIDQNCKDIVKTGLKFKINDSDENALEEALILKEKYGGAVTVVSLCSDKELTYAEQVIWECYAKGTDHAILICDKIFENLDPYITSRTLAEVLRGIKYDLILTGCQAVDDSYMQIGPMIAEILGIPYTTLAVKMQVLDNERILVHRELEEGYRQAVEIKLPALITIQTGINLPRYAALIKVLAAKKKPIRKITAQELKLNMEMINSWRSIFIEEMYIPKAERAAQIITGSPAEAAAKLALIVNNILKSG